MLRLPGCGCCDAEAHAALHTAAVLRVLPSWAGIGCHALKFRRLVSNDGCVLRGRRAVPAAGQLSRSSWLLNMLTLRAEELTPDGANVDRRAAMGATRCMR